MKESKENTHLYVIAAISLLIPAVVVGVGYYCWEMFFPRKVQ